MLFSLRFVLILVALAFRLVFWRMVGGCSTKKSGRQTFVVESNGVSRSIYLPIRIVDWRVDCAGSRAVVWGFPKAAGRVGGQPCAIAHLIDLKRFKSIAKYSVARGPYEVEFSADQKKILLDDVLIDYEKGALVVDFGSRDFGFERQTCEDFPGRKLLR